ncbi:MAG: hypothetical protein ACRDX8_06190 [Acidimicrobiales bacterium]
MVKDQAIRESAHPGRLRTRRLRRLDRHPRRAPPVATVSQVGAAILGAVDSGPVTGSATPNANKNPEGAFS